MFKILIVDDSEYITQPLVGFFKSKHCEAVGYTDGFAAIEYLKSNTVDVILSDISMPEIDGIEMMKSIQFNIRKQPLLVYLTGTTNLDPVEIYRRGARAVLQKPILPENLYEVLKLLVTERMNENEKQNRLELERIKILETHNQATFGEFSRSLVHEINNALTVVSFNSHMLSKHLSVPYPISEDVFQKSKALAESTQKNMERVNRIIEDLKSLLLQSKKPQKELKPIKAIFEEAIHVCTPKLFNFNINIWIDTNFDPTLEIFCSPSQIVQVLVNLINNAADAISLLSEKRIVLNAFSTATHTVISVTDNGPGIPKHLQEKIMTPLFTTKHSGQGLGLGLNICLKIIEAHGGTVSVDPDCVNTRFNVSIPLPS